MNTKSTSIRRATTTPEPKLKPKQNSTQMLRFIRLIHGKPDMPPWFQTYSKARAQEGGGQSFSAAPSPKLRDRLLSANVKHMNVSMAINEIDGTSRKFANVTRINAVFVDRDGEGVEPDELLALPLKPDLVVQTSPDHFHAYWLVADCDVRLFKAVQIALAQRFGTDPNITDAARVMRMPGTINWKYKKPYLARIVHSISRKPVTLIKLVKKLGLGLEISKAGSLAAGAETATDRPDAAMAQKIQVALVRIGSADDRATWLRAGKAIHSVFSDDQGYTLWTSWSRTSSKFDEADQRKTWGSFKPGAGINIATLFWMAGEATLGSSLDSMNLSKLFASNYAANLRFDAAMGCWYSFNGVVWVSDKQAPMRMAKALIEDLSAGEGRRQDGLKAHRSPAGLSSIQRMAELEEAMVISEKQFDRSPHLLAVKNGVIDLPTGTFRPTRADEFLRRQADVAYDPKAKAPQWRKFIDEVTRGDRQLARFLRRAVGYTLFGHAKAQVFFVLDGAGGNGKGVFLRVLSALLGQYSAKLAPNLVTSAYSSNPNSSTSALMALKGIRLGIVTELPNKRGFDTAFVKQFSGGDAITARPNYGELITFQPEGKLWISTNDMPEIPAGDLAMWRRIVAIPFRASFPIGTRDEDLEDKLVAEWPGILNWALQGARDYAAIGRLGTCEAVESHKARMRRDADVFGNWLSEHCARRAGAVVASSAAYGSYSAYAKKLGRVAMGMPAFGKRMVKEGFARKYTKRNNGFVGVVLNDSKK